MYSLHLTGMDFELTVIKFATFISETKEPALNYISYKPHYKYSQSIKIQLLSKVEFLTIQRNTSLMPWGTFTKFGSFLPNAFIISLAIQTSYAWKLLSLFLCPPRKYSYRRVAIIIGIDWKIFALSALESLRHLRLESWIG